jgi:hypothetical protein
MEPISNIIESAEKGANLFVNIFEKIENARKLKDFGHSIIRMLYLEISWNLDMLDIINWRELTNIDYQNNNLKEIISRLEHSVAEIILINAAEDGQRKAFNLLKNKGDVKDSEFSYDNVLQYVSFYYLKIKMLHEIITLSNINNLLVKIKINARLQNIKKRLIELKSFLDKFEELKELKR